MVRVASAAALQHLDPREQAVIALLARTPGIDRHLLDKLAGRGFVDRAVAAGIPLRRQVTGALDLAAASAFRAAPADPQTAGELAVELLERGRPLEAVGLLLDAGDHERATRMVMGLSESITDTVEPRQMLSLLARLGPTTDREPLPPLAAGVGHRARWVGSTRPSPTSTGPSCIAADAAPVLRRRVAIESAPARLAEGRHEEAVRIARETLAELGDGETRTYARANELLAECAATFDAREDLQNAAESYRSRRRRGSRAASSPGPAPAGGTWPSACSPRSAASTRRWPRSASSSAPPTSPTPSARGRCWSRGSCCTTPTASTAPSAGSPASPTSATSTTTRG